MVSTPIQIFFAWRIKLLTKSNILALVIVALSIVSLGRRLPWRFISTDWRYQRWRHVHHGADHQNQVVLPQTRTPLASTCLVSFSYFGRCAYNGGTGHDPSTWRWLRFGMGSDNCFTLKSKRKTGFVATDDAISKIIRSMFILLLYRSFNLNSIFYSDCPNGNDHVCYSRMSQSPYWQTISRAFFAIGDVVFFMSTSSGVKTYFRPCY